MKENSKNYNQFYSETSAFFDEILPSLIQQADIEFNKPLHEWLKNIYKELISIKKDDPDRYQKTAKILRQNTDSLKNAICSATESSRFESFLELFIEKLESVPANIVEVQSPDRFRRLEGDNFYISVLKFGKRLLKPWKNGQVDKNWIQQIPFKDLLIDQLMSDPMWIETWMAESFRDTSEILDMLLEKKIESNETDEEAKFTFKVGVIEEAEKHIENAIKRLESNEMLNNHELSELIDSLRESVKFNGERIGTIEGKSIRVNEDSLKRYSQKLNERFQSIEEAWNIYLESQISDLNIQTEIAEYGYFTTVVQRQILEEIHNYFRDYGYVPMEKGVSAAKTIVEQLKKSNSETLSKKLVDEIREQVDHQIKDAILKPMQQTDLQQKTLNRVRDKISELQLKLSDFSETVKLAEKREIKIPKPIVEFDELMWQSLATRFIQQKGLRQLQPEKMELVQFIRQKAIDVEENIQIVDVNLMAAIESKDSENPEEESPLMIAVSGLERAVNLFEQSIKSVREKQNEYETYVKDKLPAVLYELAEIMLNREYDKFEFQDKALQVKEKATDWKKRFLIKFDKWVDKGELAWRFLSQKFKKVKSVILRYLGFRWEEAVSIREKRSLTEYLVKNQMEEPLPFIYRRLFDFEFNVDWRFYILPDGVFQSLEKAYMEWQRGLDSNVLIIGEKGSGKSTVVRFATKRLFEKDEVLSVDFENTFYTEKQLLSELSKVFGFKISESKSELIDKILKRRKKAVIFIENLHNAYIRNIHGFEALDSFWEIMSATKEKLFWVVTTSRYSWQFFEKMTGADQYFSYIAVVDTLNKEQLKKAIMVRHRSTGYNLIFEPGPAVTNSRVYRKFIDDEEKAQEYLKELYFTKLANVSEGNLSIAIIFWLQSIREFDDVVFRVAPLEIADVDKLETPARDVLFTLAAFVTHDRLTSEEMAMALHQDVTQSRLMLTRLKSKGIIYKTEHGYNMNQLVYRQVIRLLKRRNIIH